MAFFNDVNTGRELSSVSKKILFKVPTWSFTLLFFSAGGTSNKAVTKSCTDCTCCIISKKVVEQLKQMKEPHNFLRGMVAYIGFKQCEIIYDRDQRFKGETKYNKYLGSIKIALNGLLGFSSKPLRIMTLVGFILSMISFSIGFWYLIQKLLGEDYSPGLPTNVLLITFFSGVQLLALGLIGEYIGRIYDQVKQRPPYIIEKKINFDHKNEK